MYAVKPSANSIQDTIPTWKDAWYSLSNVILADEKLTLFHQYIRYSQKWGTIVFSIPGAILWA